MPPNTAPQPEPNTMLYRAPGPHDIHGHKVEYTVVPDSQIDEKLAAGWFMSAVAAGEAWLKAEAAKLEAEVEAVEEAAVATRDEAIQKLEQLGVTFDRRLGLSRLLKLVDETLAGRAPAPANPVAAPAQG